MLYNNPDLDLDPMFCEIPSEELDGLFTQPVQETPDPCAFCFETNIKNWVIICDNGHSLCGGCANNLKARPQADHRCWGCRDPLTFGQSGNFVSNLTANQKTADFYHRNPDYDPNRVEPPPKADCPHADAGCPVKDVTREQLKEHLERHCAHRVIPCTHRKFGCTHTACRSEMQEHLQLTDHVQFLPGMLRCFAEDAQKREADFKTTIKGLEEKVSTLVTIATGQQSVLQGLSDVCAQQRERIQGVTSAVQIVDGRMTGLEAKVETALGKLPVSRPGGSDRQDRQNRLNIKRRVEVEAARANIAVLQGEVDELEAANDVGRVRPRGTPDSAHPGVRPRRDNYDDVRVYDDDEVRVVHGYDDDEPPYQRQRLVAETEE